MRGVGCAMWKWETLRELPGKSVRGIYAVPRQSACRCMILSGRQVAAGINLPEHSGNGCDEDCGECADDCGQRADGGVGAAVEEFCGSADGGDRVSGADSGVAGRERAGVALEVGEGDRAGARFRCGR